MLPELAFQPRGRYGMTLEGGGGGVVGKVKGAFEDVVEAVGGAAKSAGKTFSKGAGKLIDIVKDVGRDIDDFVNEEVPGGWAGAAAIAGGTYYLTSAAGAPAAVGGGAGGVSGSTGLASQIGTTGGLAGGVQGGTGLLYGTPGVGFTATGAGAPGLAAMGGGTGLLATVPGGVIGATGFTPAAAVPILGSPSSFINNPTLLGKPVIGGNPAIAAPSITDVLRAANLGRSLFGARPAQQAVQQPVQRQLASQLSGTGVDLLSIPQIAARRAEIASLFNPNVSAAPVFDPVTGTQINQTLLG